MVGTMQSKSFSDSGLSLFTMPTLFIRYRIFAICEKSLARPPTLQEMVCLIALPIELRTDM